MNFYEHTLQQPKHYIKKQLSKIIFTLGVYSAGQTVQLISGIINKSYPGLKYETDHVCYPGF